MYIVVKLNLKFGDLFGTQLLLASQGLFLGCHRHTFHLYVLVGSWWRNALLLMEHVFAGDCAVNSRQRLLITDFAARREASDSSPVQVASFCSHSGVLGCRFAAWPYISLHPVAFSLQHHVRGCV